MNRKRTSCLALVLSAIVLLCLAPPAALAAGSTEVYVNGQLLNAGNPYWKNGNLPASENDWNAHFDVSTATLTLKDAKLDTTYDTGYHSLVFAPEDAGIVFLGRNEFAYTSAASDITIGVYVRGDMTINGDGSADFRLRAADAGAQAAAIYGDGMVTIHGGNITVDIRAGFVAVGMRGASGILYAGGHTDIYTEARRSYGAYTNYSQFRMTGGTLSATSVSTGEIGYALTCSYIILEGGEGVFRAYGPGAAYGLYLWGNGLQYTDGRYIFSGDTSALYYEGIISVAYTLTGGPVYVSGAANGDGKWLWTSAAKDGRLESNLNEQSSFKYVQFGEWPPQTGDGQTPWLWAGIALCTLLFAAGVLVLVNRKRR